MGVIVSFGEVLLRIAARPPLLLLQEAQLEATICGAEANVAVAFSGFGHASRMISFVPDNRLGDAARNELRRFGVGTDAVKIGKGRMGLYFLTPGAMTRPAEIIYDRAGSAFANLDAEAIDWQQELAGADWLFIGGITAALGDGPLAALRSAIACAKQNAVNIAFDCNYRPSLWQGREQQAARILLELSSQATLLFGGRRAIGMMLDQQFNASDPNRGFQDAANAMFAASPGLAYVAATRRDIISAENQRLTALIADNNSLAVSPTIALDGIVDRIGTGDAFAAGVVHGLVSGHDLDQTIGFAAAAAQWSHGISGDFLRASVSDIIAMQNGGGDVRR
ncbi:sugar kinase [Novosphingobium aerophilum]|uniref:sugar kinase n=1 Tax=Novosphingobium aerophilum TaxID=2839843 RepID=UPI00163A34A0|nr:sugar kinase [Novosphingobium aerophilum]